MNYIYDDGNPKVTVKLKNGKEIESEDGWIYLPDRSISIWTYLDKTQRQEPWSAGNTYEAEVWVGGYSQTVDYTIVENPIVSLTVGDLSYPEYTNGYYAIDNNQEV